MMANPESIAAKDRRIRLESPRSAEGLEAKKRPRSPRKVVPIHRGSLGRDQADPSSTSPAPTSRAAELAWRGIEHCRAGEWTLGLYWLSLAAESDASSPGGNEDLPTLFYSYLGYGMARFQDRVRLGQELCRRALVLELYQPEAYYFLAETLLLTDERRQATQLVSEGLTVDPDHPQLLDLQTRLGARRLPVVPFLTRQSLLNRWLGRLRHSVLTAEETAVQLKHDDGSEARATVRQLPVDGTAKTTDP